jgi:hypothetical protein
MSLSTRVCMCACLYVFIYTRSSIINSYISFQWKASINHIIQHHNEISFAFARNTQNNEKVYTSIHTYNMFRCSTLTAEIWWLSIFLPPKNKQKTIHIISFIIFFFPRSRKSIEQTLIDGWWHTHTQTKWLINIRI